MQHALYYEGQYLLLPKEFDDYESFMRNLYTRELPAQYQMVILREDHKMRNFSVVKGRSMAPYFLSGYHDDAGLITIANPEEVYPVEVEVMEQSEYNAKLREVINRVCPGCLRFKPLSNRVQSLNGHFVEMTLDGVCMFRQETKPSPRIFHDHLFSFGGFFKRGSLIMTDAQRMRDDIKHWFYILYADAVLSEDNTLVLRCKKNDLLSPILTEAISRYMDVISENAYRIRLADRFICTEDALMDILKESNSEEFRKECKKYGVSLAVLKFDEAAADTVHHSLKHLCDHFWIFPLLYTKGKAYYLVADTSYFLKELRYRSPLLEAHHASVDVYDQYQNASYQISFTMKKT